MGFVIIYLLPLALVVFGFWQLAGRSAFVGAFAIFCGMGLYLVSSVQYFDMRMHGEYVAWPRLAFSGAIIAIWACIFAAWAWRVIKSSTSAE